MGIPCCEDKIYNELLIALRYITKNRLDAIVTSKPIILIDKITCK